MEHLTIPEDLIHVMSKPERLEGFRMKFELDNCTVKNSYLVVQGKQQNVDRAQQFALTHWLSLRKAAGIKATDHVTIPKHITITEEEVRQVITDPSITFFVTTRLIKLSGNANGVSEAKQHLEYYFSSVLEGISPGPEVKKTKKRLTIHKQDASTDVKARHLEHFCIFCNRTYSSKYLRKHVTEICSCKRSLKFNKEERHVLLDEYYNTGVNPVEKQNNTPRNSCTGRTCSDEDVADIEPLNPIEQTSNNEKHSIKLVHAMNRYENWMANSVSGKSEFSNVTRRGRMNALRAFIDITETTYLHQMLSRESTMQHTEILEARYARPRCYEFALAIKEFLL